jgi:hypothetical protein
MECVDRILAPARRWRALNVGKMQISHEQMATLGAAMRRQFEVDAITMLRRNYPGTTEKHADDALRLFVRHGIERAKASRMDAVTDVQRWLCLMQRLIPYFDSSNEPHLIAVRAVLDNVVVYAPIRLNEAEAIVSEIAREPT